MKDILSSHDATDWGSDASDIGLPTVSTREKRTTRWCEPSSSTALGGPRSLIRKSMLSRPRSGSRDRRHHALEFGVPRMSREWTSQASCRQRRVARTHRSARLESHRVHRRIQLGSPRRASAPSAVWSMEYRRAPSSGACASASLRCAPSPLTNFLHILSVLANVLPMLD